MIRFLPCILAAATLAKAAATELTNDAFRVRLAEDGALLVSSADASARFLPRFTILAAGRDPKAEMRLGDWGEGQEKFIYNVLTWDTVGAASVPIDKSKHVEDGFDPKSDRKADAGRTFDFLKAAPSVIVNAEKSLGGDGRITWGFAEQPDFALSAVTELPAGKAEPLLTFHFTPKTAKWFSVGYTGANEVEPAAMEEMWQPLVWQEKRFPNLSYLTESGRCTLPGTFVRRGGVVSGVIADPSELPFMPMPTAANSRFGVAVRNAAGKAQPMLFAPILGGLGLRWSRVGH